MEKSKIRSILVPFCPPLSPVQVNEIVSAIDAVVNETVAEITAKIQVEAKETKEEPEQPETSKAASSEKATKQPASKSEKKPIQKKS